MRACSGKRAKAPGEQSSCCKPHSYLHTEMLGKLAVAAEPSRSNTSAAPAHILRHRQSQQHAHKGQQPLQQQGIDTEAGMLSGISQKHRSRPAAYTGEYTLCGQRVCWKPIAHFVWRIYPGAYTPKAGANHRRIYPLGRLLLGGGFRTRPYDFC